MRCVIFLILLHSVLCRPDYSGGFHDGGKSGSGRENIKILKDVRVHPQSDGSYSFDFETEDGIKRSESGQKSYGNGGSVGQSGSYSFKFPNGEEFELKFVADENGYQPQSSWLPVAPAFPHPIPQFVLDQIEKAAREDADRSRSNSDYRDSESESLSDSVASSYRAPSRYN